MFNWSSKTLKRKQYYYDKNNTENIYFNKAPKTLKELIIRLLWGMEETYYDLNGKRLHCLKNRMRTFKDCYLLARTYFPGITFETVYGEIKNIMEDARNISELNAYYLDWPFLMCEDASAATFRQATNTKAPEY